MISCTENLKKSIKKQDITKKYSKTAGYKVSRHKSVIFLFRGKEHTENEIKTTSLTVASQRRE